MKKYQNGFAPIIIVFLVTISLVVLFVLKYQGTYQSPLGFSFTKPSVGTIEETSFDVSYLDTPNQPGAFVDPKRVITTSTSVGTNITSDAYRLSVTKTKDVGSVPPEISDKLAYGGGYFFQFLQKDKTLYNEVLGLIDKKIEPQNSNSFRDSGQDSRFDVTSYNNSKSNLAGIKYFEIGGYETPGLRLSSGYYLLDPNRNYIIYISSDLSCSKKDQLEEKYKVYNSDGNSYTIVPNFNADEYNKSLHDLAIECESSSKYKNDLDSLLDSLKFN